MNKYKIAIFYRGYLPGAKFGGPVTSAYNLTELLGEDVSFFIVCANHDLHDSQCYRDIHEGWNRVGKAKVRYLSDEDYNQTTFGNIIDEISPDLLYVSSIFAYGHVLPILNLSQKKHIPLLLAPRGELNNTALGKKSLKKKLYLTALRIGKKLKTVNFQATSEEEYKNIIQNLHVEQRRVSLLPNVPSLPTNKSTINKRANYLKLCYVGRIVENKNLFIALEAVCKCQSNIEFDIYGPKEDREYWNKCNEIIEKAPVNITIAYRGTLKCADMINTYSQYDCLISPTEFENYGQSIVEAMLHDVPVIISKGTTPWDDIETNKSGFVIPLNQKHLFSQAIDTLAQMNNAEYLSLINRLRAYCANKFNYSELRENYLHVFDRIINK